MGFYGLQTSSKLRSSSASEKILPGKSRGWKQNPRWVPSASPSKKCSTVTVQSITLLIYTLVPCCNNSNKTSFLRLSLPWSSQIPTFLILFRTYIPSQNHSNLFPWIPNLLGHLALGLARKCFRIPLLPTAAHQHWSRRIQQTPG